MKIKKQDLEALVANGVELAGAQMSMLVVLRCPVRAEYERVENFLHNLETIATEVGIDMKGLLKGDVAAPKPAHFGFAYEGRK